MFNKEIKGDIESMKHKLYSMKDQISDLKERYFDILEKYYVLLAHLGLEEKNEHMSLRNKNGKP